VLTGKPMNRVDAYRMVRRRTADGDFKVKLGCHVFRATGLTACLEAGGTLENAQAMAAHESPRSGRGASCPAPTGRLPSTLSAADLCSALFEASSVLYSRPTPRLFPDSFVSSTSCRSP
jgi:hypothetical protein